MPLGSPVVRWGAVPLSGGAAVPLSGGAAVLLSGGAAVPLARWGPGPTGVTEPFVRGPCLGG
jgi:hypothetical protein